MPEGEFDILLEGAGGDNNGSTSNDRTNYVIDVPANALELALFLESDRMGYLLDTMSPERVDGQRDVVKNERRQSFENRPYGMASIELDKMLWPATHPYSWPTIGHMEDLTAASYSDVVEFFKTYYAPNNASLVIAGESTSTGRARSSRNGSGRFRVDRGRADRAPGRHPDRSAEEDADRQRHASTSVPRVVDAAFLCARRLGPRRHVFRADRRQKLPPLQAPRV